MKYDISDLYKDLKPGDRVSVCGQRYRIEGSVHDSLILSPLDPFKPKKRKGIHPIVRYLEKREQTGYNHIVDHICEDMERQNTNGFNGLSIDKKADMVLRTYNVLKKLDKEVLNK
jgi:hypothetical protein